MLGSDIRRLIGPALRECPRECGIVSIVEVEVSADFTYATILISALKKPEKALQYLERHRSDVQSLLRDLPVHRTPKLRFRIDTGAAHGARIDELLEKASKRNSDDTSESTQDQPSEK